MALYIPIFMRVVCAGSCMPAICICPNVISMTMNVIIQECIIENCFIEPYV